MSRHVFPHAPSPTITSFRRISAMVQEGRRAGVARAGVGAAAGGAKNQQARWRQEGGVCIVEVVVVRGGSGRASGLLVARHPDHRWGRAGNCG